MKESDRESDRHAREKMPSIIMTGQSFASIKTKFAQANGQCEACSKRYPQTAQDIAEAQRILPTLQPLLDEARQLIPDVTRGNEEAIRKVESINLFLTEAAAGLTELT